MKIHEFFLYELQKDYNIFINSKDYYQIVKNISSLYEIFPKPFPTLDVICGYIVYPIYPSYFTESFGYLVYKECEFCHSKDRYVTNINYYLCGHCLAPLYRMGKEFKYE